MDVNTAELEKAADLVETAAGHFKARNAELHDVVHEASGRCLDGGYGKTGGYQRGLANFGEMFVKIFNEFLVDEDAFCSFLDGFGVRLRQAAGSYQKTELRATDSMNQIAAKLDTLEGPKA
ncbi:hypothetical protein GCM10027598_82240 [Amycolatopsis oliviviridis]|uniref:WXG100 family type VII secretion target n=1 Tax=Amycolatopsis oliviviridis TaxID=1471590 RepID=A0ABQ3LA71_9PSEU|nr:hypothetical protein [Amycolatopsis oliviviridis]GHH06579.1 hypothetical protein GCM10017790_12140 [Amycolatopsis oliviviridis]